MGKSVWRFDQRAPRLTVVRPCLAMDMSRTGRNVRPETSPAAAIQSGSLGLCATHRRTPSCRSTMPPPGLGAAATLREVQGAEPLGRRRRPPHRRHCGDRQPACPVCGKKTPTPGEREPASGTNQGVASGRRRPDGEVRTRVMGRCAHIPAASPGARALTLADDRKETARQDSTSMSSAAPQ